MVEFCMFISSYEYPIRFCYWNARDCSMVDVAVKRCDSIRSYFSTVLIVYVMLLSELTSLERERGRE